MQVKYLEAKRLIVFYLNNTQKWYTTLAPINCLCKGIHVLRATTPPMGLFTINAVYSAIAPPCEKPPMNILSLGMPSFTSASINCCTGNKKKNW